MSCSAGLGVGGSPPERPADLPLAPSGLLFPKDGDRSLKANKSNGKIGGMLGLGLDGDDGHTRLTRGDNFLLFGGSESTHARMQETAIKLNERLEKRGKRLGDVSIAELREICEEASR